MVKSKIQVLSSGSKGNCILVYDSRGKCVMLDMGVSWEDVILRKMYYDISSISMALATHNHKTDHTRSLSKCIKSGIPCYGNKDVCINHKGCNLIEKMVKVDKWRVQTFELVHNVPNNAFIVDTFDGIRILYCTDTQYIPKVVKGVNYIIIECNYDENLIIDNICEGQDNRSQSENHQSLEQCILYLKKIYNKDLQAVILSHISETNGSPIYFQKRVKEELGFPNVFIADTGLEVDLLSEEF